MSSTRQNYKRIKILQNFCDNRNFNKEFPMEFLTFQASQQIKSGDDIPFTINTIKHILGKIGNQYSVNKKTDNLPKDLRSP